MVEPGSRWRESVGILKRLSGQCRVGPKTFLRPSGNCEKRKEQRKENCALSRLHLLLHPLRSKGVARTNPKASRKP